jgi:hypothetical protein
MLALGISLLLSPAPAGQRFFWAKSSLQPPTSGMSDKHSDRLEKLLQAAGKKLCDDDVEILKEKKGLLLENELLSPSAIEPYTKDELRGLGFSAGCAALLKKAFPCKLSEWCLR